MFVCGECKNKRETRKSAQGMDKQFVINLRAATTIIITGGEEMKKQEHTE